MSESEKKSWDSVRVEEIIGEAIQSEQTYGEVANQLTELLGKVRAEAIGWTWTEACSQMDRGFDPRVIDVARMHERAKDDLNPERE